MASNVNRRSLLAGTLLGFAASGQAGAVSGEMPWSGASEAPPQPNSYRFRYFTGPEAAFIEAIIERIIPTDDLGPGARDAGVAQFIDAQLAGPYGRGVRWYMRGPWSKGAPTQGYQTRRTPAELYRAAIAAIEHETQRRRSISFAQLSGEDQDGWLHELENGHADLGSVDGKQFFDLLLQNTQEGFWSDPLYGGNRNMCGWKLIGFPGARYDRRDWVLEHNKPYPYPPVGIRGRPAWEGEADC